VSEPGLMKIVYLAYLA